MVEIYYAVTGCSFLLHLHSFIIPGTILCDVFVAGVYTDALTLIFLTLLILFSLVPRSASDKADAPPEMCLQTDDASC